MNVLLIGKDSRIFEVSDTTENTRSRHLEYARELSKQLGEDSCLYVIAYTNKRINEERIENLILIPTNSKHRALYFIDVLVILFRKAKLIKPQVISPQTLWEEGIIALLFAKLLNIKLIPQIHFNLFSDNWLKSSKINYLRKFLAKIVIKNADRIRVVSSSIKNDLVLCYQINPSLIYNVPVFSELKKSSKTNYQIEALTKSITNKKVVLYLGRLAPEKNFKCWLKTAQLISKNISDIIFIIAGDGEGRDEIKEMANEYGISDLVILLGAIPHNQVKELFSIADLFLFTSHHEGFGRVILESYLSKVPVVATISSDPENLIRNGKTGFRCRDNDHVELSKYSLELLKNNTAELYAEAGYKLIVADYSKSSIVRNLIKCWCF